MKINNEEIDLNKIIDTNYEDKMLKRRDNGLYLSDEQINILNKYDIDYLKCSNIKEIVFIIEDILNEETDLDDLDKLSMELSEYNYYYHTDK